MIWGSSALAWKQKAFPQTIGSAMVFPEALRASPPEPSQGNHFRPLDMSRNHWTFSKHKSISLKKAWLDLNDLGLICFGMKTISISPDYRVCNGFPWGFTSISSGTFPRKPFQTPGYVPKPLNLFQTQKHFPQKGAIGSKWFGAHLLWHENNKHFPRL